MPQDFLDPITQFVGILSFVLFMYLEWPRLKSRWDETKGAFGSFIFFILMSLSIVGIFVSRWYPTLGLVLSALGFLTIALQTIFGILHVRAEAERHQLSPYVLYAYLVPIVLVSGYLAVVLIFEVLTL
jgi:hypothetical protein